MHAGGSVATLSLPARTRSVATARRTVLALCGPAGLAGLGDTAALLTSEVVTNAVVHGQGTVHLRARASAGRLRVEVQDDGAGSPSPRQAADDAEGGRGLALVAVLAATWGVERLPRGKVVWFELEDVS